MEGESFSSYRYLFAGRVRRSDEAIALTDDGWMLATSDGVHEPVSVVVVDDMNETPPAPRHPLHQSLPEVVESHCYLHPLII